MTGRKPKVKFPGPMPAGTTLTLSKVPDGWAVENGYAEWREPWNAPRYLRGAGYGYRGGLPGPTTNPGIRWRGSADRDRVLFHYFFGKPAPANRYLPGSVGFEQWDYSPTKKAYKGRVAAICGASRNELAIAA